jgi:hypothetical protein
MHNFAAVALLQRSVNYTVSFCQYESTICSFAKLLKFENAKTLSSHKRSYTHRVIHLYNSMSYTSDDEDGADTLKQTKTAVCQN